MLLALLCFAVFAQPAQAMDVTIYKTASCGHCIPYIAGVKEMFASDFGVTDVVEKNALATQEGRVELANLQESANVPLRMQGHLVVSVDNGKYLFEGHVPVAKMRDFLKSSASKYDKIVVTLETMTDDPLPYTIFANGVQKACTAQQLIEECDKSQPSAPNAQGGPASAAAIETGLYGGLTPAQIGILALFVVVPIALIIKYGKVL